MEITETVHLTTRAAWRAWLARHHATKREIWLIYYKKSSGKRRVAYGDAVEEALCFGWIDTTTKALDADRYAQRFTPRKRGSNWSTPNLIRVRHLVTNGLMTPAGVAHIPSRRAAKDFRAKHKKRLTGTTVAPRDLSAELRRNGKAAAFWKVLTPGYKRLYIRWMTDAKRADTRRRRVAEVAVRMAKGIKHPLA